MTTEVWAPLCMDAPEWVDWQRLNPVRISERADRPCADCPMDFANQMRSEGRCNGEPGGVESLGMAVVEPSFHVPPVATTRGRGYPRSGMEVVARMARDRTTKVEDGLDVLGNEAIVFLTKAFRGTVRLDEPENRILATAASAAIGSWTRYQATKSQRAQTELVRSAILQRDLGGKQTDYLDTPRLTEGDTDGS